MTRNSGARRRSIALWRLGWGAAACLASLQAHASMFEGETLDAVANGIALFVIFLVPIVGIAVFWIVHVLPEKIAHKRHHPQRDAIQVLCLLSLVFGGLLWPLAWLWAYSKPVLHQLAYGTDKHEDYHVEKAAEAAKSGTPPDLRAEFSQVRGNVERVLARGGTPTELAAIRDQLAALEPRIGTHAAATAGPAATEVK